MTNATPLQTLLKVTAATLILSVAIGCNTSPVKPAEKASDISSPQSLSGTLFVEHENKGYKLKTDINIVNAHALRMDISTSLDLPEASIVLTEEKVEYLLYREKKYYSGRASPHSLDPVFPLAVDADTLVKILLEEKPNGDQCEVENGFLTQCLGKVGELEYRVTWTKRQGSGPLAGRASKMVLDLPAQKLSLRFYFSEWQKNVSNAERFLTLQVPPGFRSLSTPSR
jgi:hypothetical protein